MDEEKIRVLSTSWGKDGEYNNKLEIDNLSENELEIMEGWVSGSYHVSVNKKGRMEKKHLYDELKTIQDDAMLPFWKPCNDKQQYFLDVDLKKLEERYTDFASITIQHLCGYNYSPENYRKQVELLESYGFSHLRSKRGVDGKFWEMWYLPSLVFAEGKLEICIQDIKNSKEKLKKAVDFLCNTAQFGSLDVSVQRAAMPVPD